MATKTNKLGLTLPAGSETVNINVLNDNFSIIDEKVGSTIVYEGDFGTNEELLEKINAAYSMVDDNSVGHAKLRATVEGLEIGGGTWHFTFYRTNATYGWLECGTYYGNYKYYRRLYEGKWEEWVDISPRPPVPAIHASQHAADGNDPLTPEMIGITTIVATDENDDGNVVLEAYVGDSYAEHTGAQNNPHNVTVEQIGAAPSGYGLGENVQKIDLDTVTKSGNYKGSIDLGANIGVATCWCRADMSSDNYGTMTAYSEIYGGFSLKRTKNNGVWDEWEWVNPPMQIDVEYRTTERFDDKAVYKKKDSSGQILYRLDGETEWKTQAPLMGAAPAGYGLGENAVRVADLNANGYVATNATPNGLWYWGQQYNFNDKSAAQVLYGSNNSVLMRQKVNGAWGDFVDWSPSAFAPSGYGLGALSTDSASLSDANTAIKSGWYRLSSSTANGIGSNCVIRVDSYGSNYCTQTAYLLSLQHNTFIQRQCVNGTWTEWEWNNPPMSTDVEYRTTERINGKSVYKKRDSNGAMWYRLDGESGWTEGVPGAAPAYSWNSGTLSSAGWYKVGTIKPVGGDFTTAGRITIGGNYNTINHSSAIIDVITDYDSIDAAVIVPTMKNAGVTQVGFIRTEMKTFDVYVGYANNTVNAIYISVDMTRGTFVKANFVPSSVAESGMAKIVAINKGSFAPSGYVVGHYTAVTNAEIDAAVANMYAATPDNSQRFYKLYVNANGLDIASGSYFVTVQRTDADWGNIYCSQYSYYGMTVTRCKYGGAWQPWEWENPPMILGVEYRTTERWNGKPVYTKLVSLGTLPDSATSEKDIVFFAGSMAELVGVDVSTYAGSTWRTEDTRWSKYVYKDSAGAHIVIKATENVSGYSGFAVFKYTKN